MYLKMINKLKYLTCVLGLANIISCAEQTASFSKTSVPTQVTRSVSNNIDESLFKNPTSEYKPLTWYHVMNGNMSKAGISKDLEAIASAGIGGTILFNVGLNTPKGPVSFNSSSHLDHIAHMAAESSRLGLTFGIHNCDGWSSSAGPWITPEDAMKKVTWSETVFRSNGTQQNIKLPQPMTMEDYYQDIAVLAYPSLNSELLDHSYKPVLSASDSNFDVTKLQNVNIVDKQLLEADKDGNVWLQFSYPEAVTIRSVLMDLQFGKHFKYAFHYSKDGVNFTKHADLKVNRPGRIRWALDGTFDGVTAKYFRISSNKPVLVNEAKLSSTLKMSNFLARTSSSRTDYNKLPAIGEPSSEHVIDAEQIITLTDQLSTDGYLTTQLPKGEWTIMRFGYTATGATNVPPTAAGRGLEVDKFSRKAFKKHYDAYMTNVINKVKKVAPNVMHSLEIDSYEVGGQNWTQGYQDLFVDRHGYDLTKYLPMFAGKFVESVEKTQAVTWDIRDLNNYLITHNYYQYFTELANKDGIKTYIEPYGIGPFNDVDAGSKADIPMGEFWLKRNIYMIASSTSAAHIYNKNIISAESFTAIPEINWQFTPADAKLDNDKTWALGVNQFVFHRFVHQANTHVVPGMTMERWGAHIDRTQPWWSTAGKAWFKYITRGQYLLRQGQPVSDVLWYVGDAAPTTCPDKRHSQKLIPTDINYDCINREKLQDELFFKDARYQLDHGVKYKILYLTNQDRLYLNSVKKIYQFSKQGGVIVGEPIKHLADSKITAAEQKYFAEMVDFIWSQPTTHLAVKTQSQWAELYQKHGFQFDLRVAGLKELYYTHRQTDDEDIYFVYNGRQKRTLFDATFAVVGKAPELWNAQTGQIKKLATFKINDKTTDASFYLEPNESTFVVFKKSAGRINAGVEPKLVKQYNASLWHDNQNNIILSNQTATQSLDGPWHVTFLKKYGLNRRVTFNKLVNFKNHPDPDIRAYSGISHFEQQFNVSSERLKKSRKITLDLGQVYDTANVFINGKAVGTAWIYPFTLEVTEYLKPGLNDIRIEVANSWTNRMIADEHYPDHSEFWQENGKPVAVMPDWYTQNKPLPYSGLKGKRLTFTTFKFVTKKTPLVDAGFVGPVKLTAYQTIKHVSN